MPASSWMQYYLYFYEHTVVQTHCQKEIRASCLFTPCCYLLSLLFLSHSFYCKQPLMYVVRQPIAFHFAAISLCYTTPTVMRSLCFESWCLSILIILKAQYLNVHIYTARCLWSLNLFFCNVISIIEGNRQDFQNHYSVYIAFLSLLEIKASAIDFTSCLACLWLQNE